MNSFFQKIQIEIFYPHFDNSYEKKIASIHYQVTYPDLTGDLVSRVKCFLDSGKDDVFKSLVPAVWNASSKYEKMIFNFLKPDKKGANAIIRRTVYYREGISGMSDKPLLSEISVNTDADDSREFKVIAAHGKTHVQNKIVIVIGELGSKTVYSSDFFQTEF